MQKIIAEESKGLRRYEDVPSARAVSKAQPKPTVTGGRFNLKVTDLLIVLGLCTTGWYG